jgi:hypothetical protein
MSLRLKHYQHDCLQRLDDFLRAVTSQTSPSDAFFNLTRRQYLTIKGLEQVPHVCLRVPTGGGKTTLAAFAVPPHHPPPCAPSSLSSPPNFSLFSSPRAAGTRRPPAGSGWKHTGTK